MSSTGRPNIIKMSAIPNLILKFIVDKIIIPEAIFGFLSLYFLEKTDEQILEQTFGLYGRRQEGDDLREQHRNMYIIKCETDRQSRLDA